MINIISQYYIALKILEERDSSVKEKERIRDTER